MRKIFILPLVVVMAFVLTAGIVFAGTSSPAGEFSVDDSVDLGRTGYSENVTLIRNNILDIVDVTIDSDNVTNSLGENITIDPTPSSFMLNISSDNTTEIQIDATVSGDTPGAYTGTMMFYNNTENVTLDVTLDVPIEFTSGFATFDANFTTDADQTFYFDADDVSGAKGIYVSVNDSSSIIDVEKGGSDLTSGTEELIYFDYDDGLEGEHTIDVSSTGIRKITVWLIPFEVSDVVSWEDTGDAQADMTKETLGTYSTRNLSFILNNTGSAAFNVNYTDDSENISSSGGDDISFVHNLANQSLGAGTQAIEVQYDMNGTIATDEGVYQGWLAFQLEKSGVKVPINVTLKINVTDELNVTVIDVQDLEDGDDIINASDAYLNVTVDVKYYNGTDVSNLMSVDDYFTVRLKTYYTVSEAQKEKIRTTTVQDTALGGPGPYILNVSVTDADYGGSFTVFTDVVDQDSHEGSANFSTIYINESFFVINAVATGCNGDSECNVDEVDNAEVGDKFYLDVDVKNYGYLDAEDVEIVMTHGSCITLLDDGSWDNDKTITVGDLDAGENLTEEEAWRFRARADGDCEIEIKGDSHETANWANIFTVDVEVDDPSSESSSPGGSSSSGELAIYSAPTEVFVDAGSTETITVKVRNTLDADIPNVKLYVDYIDEDWYDGPITKDVDSGKTVSYSLKFSIPSDATVKNYSIRFVVNTSAVSDKETATLIIRPRGTTVKIDTDESLEDFSLRYDLLNEILIDAESQGQDVIEAKEFLEQAKILIDEANEKFESGDITGAEALYTEIDNLLTKSEESTGTVKLKQLTGFISNWYGIVAIGTIVVLGGIVYFIRKPAGYVHGQGYTHKPYGSRSPVDKIAEKIRRLFKR